MASGKTSCVDSVEGKRLNAWPAWKWAIYIKATATEYLLGIEDDKLAFSKELAEKLVNNEKRSFHLQMVNHLLANMQDMQNFALMEIDPGNRAFEEWRRMLFYNTARLFSTKMLMVGTGPEFWELSLHTSCSYLPFEYLDVLKVMAKLPLRREWPAPTS